MGKLISQSSLEAQIKKNSKRRQTVNVGEIYPELFQHDKGLVFSETMPLNAAVIWLGAYELPQIFPKVKCPVCGKEDALIPYFCGGSMLSGCHIIKFYCSNCKEKFVTNDEIEYFRSIKKYISENKNHLKQSPIIKKCTVLPANAEIITGSDLTKNAYKKEHDIIKKEEN